MLRKNKALSTATQAFIGIGAKEYTLTHIKDCGLLYLVVYPNGYGALIRKASYDIVHRNDLWEFIVLKDKKPCYNTRIASNACIYLTEDQLVLACDELFYQK